VRLAVEFFPFAYEYFLANLDMLLISFWIKPPPTRGALPQIHVHRALECLFSKVHIVVLRWWLASRYLLLLLL